MTAAFPPTHATPPGRWLRWRWRRLASRRGRDPYREAVAGAGRAGSGFGECRGGAGGAGGGAGNWRSPDQRVGEIRGKFGRVSFGFLACTASGDCRQSRLRCAAVLDWRHGSGPRSRPGGLAVAGFEPVWCVVATPEIGVSTPQAFRDWDALCAAEGLTAEASTDKLKS
jgi:hypothetical protein